MRLLESPPVRGYFDVNAPIAQPVEQLFRK